MNNTTRRRKNISSPSVNTSGHKDAEQIRYNWAKDMLNWNDGSFQQLTPREYKITAFIAFFVFITSFIIYILTQYPSVSGGDAGELIVTAHQLGIAHPPGYPFFTLIGRFFDIILPFKTVAWRIATMSSFCGALCASSLYLTVRLWVGDHWCGMVSAYMFTFSPLIWMYQIQGEVFSINNLFVSLVLLVAVWYIRVRIYEDERHNTSFWTSEHIAYLSAFVCALGLTNQHTLVLVVVPFAFWLMFISGRDQLWNQKSIVNLSLSALAGLSPYLYLFISPRFNRVQYSWGNTATVSGFITHFLRKEYGTLQLYSGDGGTLALPARISLYFFNLFEQFTVVGVVLAAFGLLTLLLGAELKTFQWRSIGTMIIFTFTFYITFFFNLCNLPIEKPLYRGVFLRFFMQPNVIISIAIGLGLKFQSNLISSLYKLSNNNSQRTNSNNSNSNSNNNNNQKNNNGTAISKLIVILVSTLISVYQIYSHYYVMDQSQNYVFHSYGHAILDPLPQNTILLVGGDLVTNVPQYLKLCEGVRPDVDIISLEVMSWDWFTVTQGPVYKNVTFPGYVYHPNRHGGFSLKQFLDRNQHRPIYIAGDFKYGDNSFQEYYTTSFRGLTSQIIPINKKKGSYKAILKEFERYPDFELPYDEVKYPNDSWEYFLITDMATCLEKGAENLLSYYLKLEGEESDNALRLVVRMLERVLKIRDNKCWTLKHLGVAVDHLRYRTMKPNMPNSQQSYQQYTELLNKSWKTYIKVCEAEKDHDWDTIKNVVDRM